MKTNDPSPLSMKTAHALCLCALLGGCAKAPSYRPVQVKTQFSEDVLFEAASVELKARDFVVVDRNSDAYTLASRQREVATSTVPKLVYRYAYQIDTKQGVLRIAAECEENSAIYRTQFAPCESYPEKLLAELGELERAIIGRAKKTPDRNYDWEAAEKRVHGQNDAPRKKDAGADAKGD